MHGRWLAVTSAWVVIGAPRGDGRQDRPCRIPRCPPDAKVLERLAQALQRVARLQRGLVPISSIICSVFRLPPPNLAAFLFFLCIRTHTGLATVLYIICTLTNNLAEFRCLRLGLPHSCWLTAAFTRSTTAPQQHRTLQADDTGHVSRTSRRSVSDISSLEAVQRSTNSTCNTQQQQRASS